MLFAGLMKSYNNTLKRGCRIALRAKVNDSLITGLRVVDSILPVGRGQRQLILGDRYTGKTSIFLSLLITLNRLNFRCTLLGVLIVKVIVRKDLFFDQFSIHLTCVL